MKSKPEENVKNYLNLDEIIRHLNQIAGIAPSFPGKINAENGIVHKVATFDWICNMSLKSILEEKYRKPVRIENDGKYAALAELWKGNLSDVKNGGVFGLGTEIAGGIIINRALYKRSNETAGEFSSILTDFKNLNNEKRFGKIGSHKNLTDTYKDKKYAIDSHELFEKYNECDETAKEVVRDYARTIAAGIVTIQSVLDTEKFCIGGGISTQDILIAEIKDSVHDFYSIKFHEAVSEPAIEKCHFGNASGCVGALYNFLIMQNVI